MTLGQLQPRLVRPKWKDLPVFLCSSHYLHFFWAVSKNRVLFFIPPSPASPPPKQKVVSPGKATCVSLSLEARGVVGRFGVQQPDFQVCRSGPTWAGAAPGLEAISCLPKQVVQTTPELRAERGFPTGREAVPSAAWLRFVKVWYSSGLQGRPETACPRALVGDLKQEKCPGAEEPKPAPKFQITPRLPGLVPTDPLTSPVSFCFICDQDLSRFRD